MAALTHAVAAATAGGRLGPLALRSLRWSLAWPAARTPVRPAGADQGPRSQDLLKLAAGAVEGVPVLAAVLTPDRWLLWLGVLFVLSVYYFPTGVVGRLRARVEAVKTDQARG